MLPRWISPEGNKRQRYSRGYSLEQPGSRHLLDTAVAGKLNPVVVWFGLHLCVICAFSDPRIQFCICVTVLGSPIHLSCLGRRITLVVCFVYTLAALNMGVGSSARVTEYSQLLLARLISENQIVHGQHLILRPGFP